MQTSYKRFTVVAFFCLLVIVLILNGAAIRRQYAIQDDNRAKLMLTQQVMRTLGEAENAITQAETGQRGYLLTGRKEYLGAYNSSVGLVDDRINRLQQLATDNPEIENSIGDLRATAHLKMGELAKTVAMYEGGHPDQARAEVLTDLGLHYMEHIRGSIQQMRLSEVSVQKRLTEDFRDSAARTVAYIYITSAIAVFGVILLAYYILRQIHLREAHGEAIRQREEWFRVTLTSIGDAVIATDERGMVTFMNPLAEKMTGRTISISRGKTIQEVFPIFNEYTNEPVADPVKKVLDMGVVVGLANHTVLKHTDGSSTPIEDSAAPIKDDKGKLVGVVLVFRDASVERKSQEILRKTEKLAAAARLAATMAHEINNPLEAVCNLIYITKAVPGIPAEANEHLQVAEQELERVSHITRQTLGFYRDSTLPSEVDMVDLVESVLKLYQNKLNTKAIKIVRQFGECPPIEGLPGELKQVVSNLISNAADAVSMNGIITVTIACDEEEDGSQNVMITVADDGPGIPVEHRERIFEPFYTTKKEVGTGLGLWVTREIVNRHGGRIAVESHGAPGESGTVFKIELPCDYNFTGADPEAAG